MALSLANFDACDYSAELAAEKELHQSLEKKVFDIQLQKTLMRNKLQQVIDGLLPSSYGSPADAINKLSSELQDAKHSINRLEESLLRERLQNVEKFNSLQAQIDSLFPMINTNIDENREDYEHYKIQNRMLADIFEKAEKEAAVEKAKMKKKIDELSL